ncbi:hypothetical protein HAX54_012150 [Datura stramonium]|uniref:Uncharacterized protein n=1 Tax=Datura stramonium TaxID=4076 RepID=A0ABS8RZ90_DATST|nr:hypothetical protein [Datura stramonium]
MGATVVEYMIILVVTATLLHQFRREKSRFAGPWVKKLGLGSRINVDVSISFDYQSGIDEERRVCAGRDTKSDSDMARGRLKRILVEEARVDTEVTSGANFVGADGWGDHPVHIVEQMVQIKRLGLLCRANYFPKFKNL